MRYWWVNQNQTYHHEVRGGYLWSPKRNVNQARNPYYDFMREVAPGDVVFSFAGTVIRAIGIAASHTYESPKPLEFGQAGAYWDKIGWRVDVRFSELRLPLKPSHHMSVLAPLLPSRYAPLRPNGNGLQNMYLTRLPEHLAAALIDLLGAEARDLVLGFRVAEEALLATGVGLVEWEEHELGQVQADTTLPPTERQAIVLARRGQGLFKTRVMSLESSTPCALHRSSITTPSCWTRTTTEQDAGHHLRRWPAPLLRFKPQWRLPCTSSMACKERWMTTASAIQLRRTAPHPTPCR